MWTYKKESLELLRQRIDLVEVLQPHLALQRSGSAYKACCPFHEERTPSFIVQKGDTHYHCFGCGAHGDAIAFLMGHLKMGFVESIEMLAERFQVTLEKIEEGGEKRGPGRAALKAALEKASRFYHFYLLYTEEGHEALEYLYQRGIDLDFIRFFQIGLAPKQTDLLKRFLNAERVDDQTLQDAGLLSISSTGRKRDFFTHRITFPIRDPMGSVIGFSARKFKEETYGGKYINTTETALFKKSHTLFGLSYSRQRIAKERRAIIVEGQIDALRLIQSGFNLTVAGLGTAFGEGHVKELLQLGVAHVYLALDGDGAGREAAVKIGDLFQKRGVEVSVLPIPSGYDPDSLLKEKGASAFLKLIEESVDYLTFLVAHFSKQFDLRSPSGKNSCVQTLAERIRQWDQPVMVHESLRKLAQMLQVPETLLLIRQEASPNLYIRRTATVSLTEVDPHKILETDLLRWLLLMGHKMPQLVEIAQANLTPVHFRVPSCERLYSLYLEKRPSDLLSLGMHIEHSEDHALLSDIMQRKVNLQKAEEGCSEVIRKMLERQWMEAREAIKVKMQSDSLTEEEALDLARQFDLLNKKPPDLCRK